MVSIIEGLRQVLGVPDFWIEASETWNYAAISEYFIGALILCIVVSSIFKIIIRWAGK